MCLAVPGKVLAIEGDALLERRGRIDFGGVVREVSMAVVPDAAPGDYVLVHVGMAISRIDADEAARVFEYLREIGELDSSGEPA